MPPSKETLLCIRRAGFVFVSLFLLSATSALAQLSRINVGFSAYAKASAAWGDYDADGDMDVVISGETHGDKLTTLYRNNGGTFAAVATPFIGVQNAILAWGDFDNDGDLDLVVGGETDTGVVTRLYRNNAGTFVQAQALTGLAAGSAVWGDYDNDGDLDLLICGITGLTANSPVLTLLYRNNGGILTSVPTSLPPAYLGSVAWGDYDSDGDLDVLIMGATGGGFSIIADIFRNDGNGAFTNINAGLPPADLGNAAWADYDNDGDLDVAMVGNSFSPVAKIFRNDNSAFTDIGAGLTNVIWAWTSWGDYDNDGDLDLCVTGYNTDTSLPETRVYRNDAGVFPNSGATLEPMYLGQNYWADFNNDGRLDLLLVGQRDVNLGYAAWLYRNTNAAPNNPPLAPLGLDVSFQGANALLNWQTASDTQTPSAGLNYNVRLGTNTGGGQIISAQSLTGGARLLPQPGNAHSKTNLLVKGLMPGRTYFWSVQAIDTSFGSSPFALEANFTVPAPAAPGPLSLTPRVDGFLISGSGTSRFSYGIETTTNLVASPVIWTRLGTVSADESGTYHILDATNLGQRYYRAVYP